MPSIRRGVTGSPRARSAGPCRGISLPSRAHLGRADEGIWEVRDEREHFHLFEGHGWVAFDRAIKSAEEFDLGRPIDRWRRDRRHLHGRSLPGGYDPNSASFVRLYGQSSDASL